MSSREEYYGGVRSDSLALLDKKPTGRVLEIGGGEFETLRSLEAPDCEIWGVDIRPPSSQFENFVLGSFTENDVASKLPDNAFDLVIANDVIEHIVDTEQFISFIREKLRLGGRAVLSVPNARQLRLAYHVFLRGTFPRTDAGLFDATHVRWFCKDDVSAMFQKAGFKQISAKSVGRLVPSVIERTVFGEFLALQNLFLFERVDA